MPEDESRLERFLCVVFGIEGLSRHDDRGQIELQQALHRAIDEATADARIILPPGQRQTQGDGELRAGFIR